METTESFAITEDGAGRDASLLSVIGEIDMKSAPEFARGLFDAIAAGRRGLVVDLSRATFLDTAALHGLVHALERLHERGGRLALVAEDSRVRALFEVARLDSRFEIYPTRDAALDAVVR